MLGRPAGDRAGRRRVGYLPENLRIPRHHTALSALALYGQMSGLTRSEVRQRSGPLLASVDLADRARDSVRKYSKGMLQRLGLAISLLHDPDLVFLDEPTDGLDPAGRAQVRQTLVRLKAEGKTIFLNSHLLQEVEMVCDRVAILDRGLLKGLGRVEELVPHRGAGIELLVNVIGSAVSLRAAVAAFPEARVQSLDAERHAIQICLSDQAEIDRCVDALRQHALSIEALGRRRISLEEAFMEVLGLNAGKP
jgi:ABC-2 type transport system ATP-binding protein